VTCTEGCLRACPPLLALFGKYCKHSTDTHATPQHTPDWQQLAQQVMANPSSSDGGSSSAPAPFVQRLSSNGGGGGLLLLPTSNSGSTAATASASILHASGAAAPRTSSSKRGHELTLGDLVQLRQRHRLLSIPPKPEGLLEVTK